jgi:transposase
LGRLHAWCSAIARPHYADDPLGKEFKSLMGATVYALDSTTIDLCLSLFAWAPFRATKAAIKLHTLIDLRGSIPSFIHISDGKMHNIRVLDQLLAQGLLEAGAYYVMDKAYVDFARLFQLNTARAFFVTRAKENPQYEIVRRKAVNTLTGLISDYQVRLTGAVSCKRYPDVLRRVVYFDEDTGKTFEFLTNNLTLPSLTICALYKQRWQVELFFKWIKQHLRIKSFFGISENAVKTQIWVAISTYVLIAIVKKRLHLNHCLHEILRVLNLNMFEATPIPAPLKPALEPAEPHMLPIQEKLFETLGH